MLPERLSTARSRIRQTRPAPIDFMDTFFALDAYLGDSGISGDPEDAVEAVTQEIVSSHDPNVLLAQIAFLNKLSAKPGEARRLIAGYADLLRPDLRANFEDLLRRARAEGMQTHLVSRQGTLAAARTVLESVDAGAWEQEEGAGSLEAPTLGVTIMLVHAVSSNMSELRDVQAGDGSIRHLIGNMPANLTMELVRLGLLGKNDDEYSLIDRTLRIWQELATTTLRTQLRMPPRELLEEALGGVSFENFFALGMYLWAYAKSRDPLKGDRLMTLPPELPGVVIEPDIVEEFFERVVASPEWFAREFEGRKSAYDFLPFEKRPVLRLADELLVVDETYLLEKFTSTGLFWTVHDNERDNHTDRDRKRWNQAHGEMVENLVTERLFETAPAASDRSGGRSYYSEDEMKAAYPKKRVADAAVDYGEYLLLVEVTGGQLVVDTRITGDPEKFEKDTQKLVLEEAEQLHSACQSLLADQQKLTGYAPPANRTIMPIIVVGGGYPADALSRGYVEDVLQEKGWLQDPAIGSLCILDLMEVEMLESLHEQGKNPGWLLSRWKRSGLKDVAFKNFVVTEVDPDLPQPSRMTERVTAAFAAATERATGQVPPTPYELEQMDTN